MMKKILTLFAVLLTINCWAEDVSFTASAPKQVIVGKPFQLTYSVNQRSKDLRAPEMANFEILAGPYSSTSQSTQWVNGKRTSTFEQTFTYTLLANKEGEYAIQPASIIIDGEKYSSNGLKITVLPPDKETTQSSNGNIQPSTSNREQGEIFVRTIVNKTKVHEQECISLSYRLYWTGVDVAQLGNNTKIPEFTGFLKQDIDIKEVQTELEHYDGRNYTAATLYQTLLYPQHAGKITIDPANFEVIVRVRNRAQVRSIFDSFMDTYSEESKLLRAPSVTIDVASLPAGKPRGFSGGVGRFDISSSISATDVMANDAVTIKVTISGKGNMKLLKKPTIDWPEGFEVYDPKETNNFKTTATGMSGSKTIEYLAIPRNSGDWTIPAVTFSYFDTETKQYRTLQTQEYTIHVTRGANDQTTVTATPYVGKEDIKALGSDIRYITTDTPRIATKPVLTFGSLAYWLCYIIPLLISGCIFIIFHRQIRANADIQRVRYKKANKVAQKRLRTAKKLLQANDTTAFYEEIERAAWTYLSHRLAIPTAELNKENIASILREKNMSETLIQKVTDVLSAAEYARYAPAMAGDPQEVYNNTIDFIDQVEQL